MNLEINFHQVNLEGYQLTGYEHGQMQLSNKAGDCYFIGLETVTFCPTQDTDTLRINTGWEIPISEWLQEVGTDTTKQPTKGR